jgi:hypothetical protein
MDNQNLSLDVAAPDEVVTVLRAAAEQFYVSHNELLGVWQQTSTPWASIARILERAADQIENRL